MRMYISLSFSFTNIKNSNQLTKKKGNIQRNATIKGPNTKCKVRLSIWGCQSTVKCYGHIRVHREPVGQRRGEYDIWHRAEELWTTQTPCFKRNRQHHYIWVTGPPAQRNLALRRFRLRFCHRTIAGYIVPRRYLSRCDLHRPQLNPNPRAPGVVKSQILSDLRADLQCCVRDSALVVGSLL